MNLKQRIDTDIKTAMLSGEKQMVTTLRTLKSAILYAEVATGTREEGLKDADVVSLLQKELKKRQESAELFIRGGNKIKADEELREIKVIEKYLPAQLSDEELVVFVDKALAEIGELSPTAMGRAIARVKELSDGRADGARIAKVVKEKIG